MGVCMAVSFPQCCVMAGLVFVVSPQDEDKSHCAHYHEHHTDYHHYWDNDTGDSITFGRSCCVNSSTSTCWCGAIFWRRGVSNRSGQ